LKYVDLAALSFSGSLVPSVPTQLMVKFNPPKITIVYHFEKQSNQQFYHDIMLDKNMLTNLSAEDVASHLYVTEAYYFNPKQVKRPQLVSLVELLQRNLPAENVNGRKKNFFERKRFLNFNQPNTETAESEALSALEIDQIKISAQNRRNPLNNRTRLSDAQNQNRAPSHSPENSFVEDIIRSSSPFNSAVHNHNQE